jgi:hypothetical protein
MFLVVGNIVAKRVKDGTIVKVPITEYDQRSYVNLFKYADDLNAPHFKALKEIFGWIDSNRVLKCELAETLLPLVKIKAPQKDQNLQIKKLFIEAYNEYFDVVYLPQDLGL